ncbi:MAG: RNA polymerase factor sigma-32 [Bacteriovoracaceae bacterium]|jgi:RNA polymerase sigma-32 factor|nr:RNA polymerase factor sigma-32 [Bacteriovoracaceae bacterium]
MKKDKKNSPIEVIDVEVLGTKPSLESTSKSNDVKNSEVIDLNKEELLPSTISKKELLKTKSKDLVSDPLSLYLREITRYKLLSKEQEQEMTRALYETGDIEIAKKLVMANLRLVVKISMEYKYAYSNVMDLIQEGNIGLMKAVSKYDPYKGAKLSYYASWWIKSYILKFILDNFRLVKIGTTNDQKKLFYNLLKEKDRLVSMGITPDAKAISESLGVSEKSVKVMEQRLSAGGVELSLDKPLSDKDGSFTLGDVLTDEDRPSLDEELGDLQSLDILNENLEVFLDGLKPRDKEIFKKRLLSEIPCSLQSIADDYGVSRERIRQIEERLLKSLRVYMSDFFR